MSVAIAASLSKLPTSTMSVDPAASTDSTGSSIDFASLLQGQLAAGADLPSVMTEDAPLKTEDNGNITTEPSPLDAALMLASLGIHALEWSPKPASEVTVPQADDRSGTVERALLALPAAPAPELTTSPANEHEALPERGLIARPDETPQEIDRLHTDAPSGTTERGLFARTAQPTPAPSLLQTDQPNTAETGKPALQDITVQYAAFGAASLGRSSGAANIQQPSRNESSLPPGIAGKAPIEPVNAIVANVPVTNLQTETAGPTGNPIASTSLGINGTPAKIAGPDLASQEMEPPPTAVLANEERTSGPAGVSQHNPATPIHNDDALRVDTPVRDHAWANDFSQKIVWLASNDKQFAQLTLNPPQMGPIEISLNLNKDNASAVFFSQNAEVRETIEAALPRLREMLAGAGIELGQANVSAESFRQQPGSEEARQGAPRWVTDNAILGGDSARGLSEQAIIAQRGHGLVDTFA